MVRCCIVFAASTEWQGVVRFPHMVTTGGMGGLRPAVGIPILHASIE